MTTAIVTVDTNNVVNEALSQLNTALYDLVKMPIVYPAGWKSGDPVPAPGLRIYYKYGPGGADGFRNTGAAVFFYRRGGPVFPEESQLRPSYQFKLYGGTTSHDDANKVFRALCDLLHRQHMIKGSSGTVMHATMDGMGQDLFEPDTGWPFVLVFFTMMIRNN